MESDLRDHRYNRTDKALVSAKQLLTYDAETGVFRWKVDRRGHARAGAVAGSKHHGGHTIIMINGKFIMAHRLAWWWVHGHLPKPGTVDHKNNRGGDNRIANLRLCTKSQNSANRSSTNKTGYRGVCKKLNRFQAFIRVNNNGIYLGSFKTAEDAARAYDTFAKKEFGEFARLNFP